MNTTRTLEFVNGTWEDSILPALFDYIRIPNQSPIFDMGWAAAGHMDRAVDLAVGWAREQGLDNTTIEVLRLEGRTPTVLAVTESHPDANGTVLLYGHLDKQPPFSGWRTAEGLGPWTPVRQGDRLYGRGGADDGYAIFAALTAIRALQLQGIPHPRIVTLIECSEESGSPDLPAYVEAYADRIGAPKLVVCLDSGCGDYERLWATTSLRGSAVGDLRVDILHEGVHSGDASGVVPSSFRILRRLIDRLEDGETGRIRPDALHVEVPELRQDQARRAAEVLGNALYEKFPFVEGAGPTSHQLDELVLARTWMPQLSVTGQAGMPSLDQAGNVLRPFTAVKLSLRLPPTLPVESRRGRAP